MRIVLFLRLLRPSCCGSCGTIFLRLRPPCLAIRGKVTIYRGNHGILRECHPDLLPRTIWLKRYLIHGVGSCKEVGAGIVSLHNFEQFSDFLDELSELITYIFDVIIDSKFLAAFEILFLLKLIGEFGG